MKIGPESKGLRENPTTRPVLSERSGLRYRSVLSLESMNCQEFLPHGPNHGLLIARLRSLLQIPEHLASVSFVKRGH